MALQGLCTSCMKQDEIFDRYYTPSSPPRPRDFFDVAFSYKIKNYARLLAILDIRLTAKSSCSRQTIDEDEAICFAEVCEILYQMSQIKVDELFKYQPFKTNSVDPALLSHLNIKVDSNNEISNIKDRFKLVAVFHCCLYYDCDCECCLPHSKNIQAVIVPLFKLASILGLTAETAHKYHYLFKDLLLPKKINGGGVRIDSVHIIKDIFDEKFCDVQDLQLFMRLHDIDATIFNLLNMEYIVQYKEYRITKTEFTRLKCVTSFVIKKAKQWAKSYFIENLSGDILVAFGVTSVMTAEEYTRIGKIVKCFLPNVQVTTPRAEPTELTEQDLEDFDRMLKVTKKTKSSCTSSFAAVTPPSSSSPDDSDEDDDADLKRIAKKAPAATRIPKTPMVLEGLTRGFYPKAKTTTTTAPRPPSPPVPPASSSDPFECLICLERFTCDGNHVPFILPCGHSFGKSHIQELKTCPVCRADIKTPPQLNYTLRDVLAFFK